MAACARARVGGESRKAVGEQARAQRPRVGRSSGCSLTTSRLQRLATGAFPSKACDVSAWQARPGVASSGDPSRDRRTARGRDKGVPAARELLSFVANESSFPASCRDEVNRRRPGWRVPRPNPLEGGAILVWTAAVEDLRVGGSPVASVETSRPPVRATGDVRSCGSREALPAERRGGSERWKHRLDRMATGEALAAKNRVITSAAGGAKPSGRKGNRRSPKMPTGRRTSVRRPGSVGAQRPNRP